MKLILILEQLKWQPFFEAKIYGCNLAKPLLVANDDNYDLICLKKDKSLGFNTLYVDPNLTHIWFIIPRTTKMQKKYGTPSIISSKQWIPLSTINSKPNFQISRWVTSTLLEYIAQFQTLNVDIITSGGKAKSNSKYASIILNNLPLVLKDFWYYIL